MNVYPFIEAQKAERDGNVVMACRLREVSRTAYYEWSAKEPSAWELSDAKLFGKITEIQEASREPLLGAPDHEQAQRPDAMRAGLLPCSQESCS